MRLVAAAVLLSACSSHETPAKEPPPCAGIGSDHDALFKRAAELIDPYMILVDRPASTSPSKGRDLHEGIGCLDRVLAIDPTSWSVLWYRGKAYQAAGGHVQARDSFAMAYQLHPENPDIGRELGVELLELGEFHEAVRINAANSDRHPDDPDLRANLGLSLVLDGKLTAAKQVVDAAAAVDPDDAVTAKLQAYIDDIVAGRRPAPKRYADMLRGR